MTALATIAISGWLLAAWLWLARRADARAAGWLLSNERQEVWRLTDEVWRLKHPEEQPPQAEPHAPRGEWT